MQKSNKCHVYVNAENIWNMCLPIHCLRTVVTVQTIWGQMNLLTYILIITHKYYTKQLDAKQNKKINRDSLKSNRKPNTKRTLYS
jgi:hypothetical protein